MQSICKVDADLYKCVTPDIASDEFIITAERVKHITGNKRSFKAMAPYLADALRDPDYILKDKATNNMAWVLKFIEVDNVRLKLVIKIRTTSGPKNHKNSVITGMFIDEKKWNQYIRNREILYRSEK